MTKHTVRTPEEAILYLADCTLATVSSMAMKKSKSKHEFTRQIEIAQIAVDWILAFKITVPDWSRVKKILQADGKVATWAASYDCA